jgi:hypothetical protein
VSTLLAVLISLLCSIAAAEVVALCPAVTDWLIRRALARLPASSRERYEQEWGAELDYQRPRRGNLLILLWALCVYATSTSVSASLLDEPLALSQAPAALPANLAGDSGPWPLSASPSFFSSYALLSDDSQETFDVACALIARVAYAAGDIPPLPDMALRMVKSHRYLDGKRIYRGLRLYFALETDGRTAALLIIEEDDELANEIATAV